MVDAFGAEHVGERRDEGPRRPCDDQLLRGASPDQFWVRASAVARSPVEARQRVPSSTLARS